jgi:hypothetical protein
MSLRKVAWNRWIHDGLRMRTLENIGLSMRTFEITSQLQNIDFWKAIQINTKVNMAC